MYNIGSHRNGKLYKLPTDELIIEENDLLIIIVTGASSEKLSELFNVEQGGGIWLLYVIP